MLLPTHSYKNYLIHLRIEKVLYLVLKQYFTIFTKETLTMYLTQYINGKVVKNRIYIYIFKLLNILII